MNTRLQGITMPRDLQATETSRDQSQTWLEAARALQPAIEAYRDQAEIERRLPAPLSEAIREAGFYRMWLPAPLGGFEAGEETLVRVVEEVARHDASVAWNLAIGAESGAFWAFLPLETGLTMRRHHPDIPSAGSVNPSRARAVPVPGGYRVRGRWPFASGCHQAGWLIGAAVVLATEADGDTAEVPRLREDGEPEVRVFMMPMTECTILDTWHVTGLRGTGSCDVEATDVFVPDGHHFVSMGPSPTPSFYDGWLYRAPLPRLLGFVLAAVALGIARDAIDSFKALAAAKTPFGGKTLLEGQQSVHLRIGRAEAGLRAGRQLLLEIAAETDSAMQSGRGVDDDLFVSAMLARAQAVASAVQAVDLVLDCAGTSAIFEGSRLERCSRDIRTVPQHAYLSTTNFEMAGQYLMGGPLQLRR